MIFLGLAACQAETPPADIAAETPSPAEAMNDVADRYYAWTLERLPEQAYFAAIDLERHDGMFDNSFEALSQAQQAEDGFLAELEAIDAADLVGKPEWIANALLSQQLRSNVARRICREEFWNISQMGGWHSGYSQVAMLQPVDTSEQREQAMARWSKFPAFVDREVANLKAGVEQGYTVPKTVAGRVIAQLDGLLGLPTENSPFYSPAARADDDDFAAAMRELVESGIQPALQRARDYLNDEYVPVAREALSITAIPNGADCYEAMLRSYTTLDRSGKETFERGQQAVAENKAGVIELGRAAYETDDFTEILDRAKNDPADKFESAEELLQFSRDMVERAAV